MTYNNIYTYYMLHVDRGVLRVYAYTGIIIIINYMCIEKRKKIFVTFRWFSGRILTALHIMQLYTYMSAGNSCMLYYYYTRWSVGTYLNILRPFTWPGICI